MCFFPVKRKCRLKPAKFFITSKSAKADSTAIQRAKLLISSPQPGRTRRGELALTSSFAALEYSELRGKPFRRSCCLATF
jgi:hypothetical protein